MCERRSVANRLSELMEACFCGGRPDQAESRPAARRLHRLLRWLTPNGGTVLLILALAITADVWAEPLLGTNTTTSPSATTVNYQGDLRDNSGTALDGTYRMSFALYDAATGGSRVWGPEIHDAVPVSDGLFTVGLGSQTSGGIPANVWNGQRFLEVTVGEETLIPRELIRSVPVAGMALTVPDGAIGSRQMNPTFFQQCVSSDTNVSGDGQVVLELTVDFPVDATYLIFTTLMSRGGADTRLLARLEDENGNSVGRNVVNSHPTGGVVGTQTGSRTMTHHFGAGSHTVGLYVWGSGGYVRPGTCIGAIPFADVPSSASAHPGDAYEPDETSPSPIAVGETQVHSFFPQGDSDKVSFTAQAGRSYRVATSGLAQAVDTQLAVTVGGEVHTNDDRAPGDLDSELVFDAGTEDVEAVAEIVNRAEEFGQSITYEVSVDEVVP